MKANTMKISAVLATLLVSGVVAGCAASIPPKELVDARAEYQRAEMKQGANLVQAELHVAKTALDRADSSFENNGDNNETRALAYIADRKAMTVEAQAGTALAAKAQTDANSQFVTDQGKIIQNQRGALNQTSQALATTSAALGEEHQRRLDAEKRVHDALDRLAKFASMKTDTRGTVITLSGAVLFVTNKADLLPMAQEKLNQVIDALKDDDRPITINGYTDSQGALAYNESLSQRRADAVRTYMVSRGIAADRVKAVGMGPANPIADNNNAEGRANNRRVEIILPPADSK
jgi:outer membrane protein OmpA-like peptidoglycan-associated protein